MSSAPDLAGVITGWRRWHLVSADGGRPQLVSPLRSVAWPARAALVADCHSLGPPADLERHRPPSERCGCGIYALTDLTGACQVAPGPVLGCVALWGEVLEGPFGWQGSQAYPQLLYVDPSVAEPVRAGLAADYGVPVYRAPVPLDVLGAMPDRGLERSAAAVRDQAAALTAAALTADRACAGGAGGPVARAGQELVSRMGGVPARGALRSAVAALVGLCVLPAALAVAAFGVVAALATVVYRGSPVVLVSALFYVVMAYAIGQLLVGLLLRALLALRRPEGPRVPRWGATVLMHGVPCGVLIPITHAVGELDWPSATLLVLSAVGLAVGLGWVGWRFLWGYRRARTLLEAATARCWCDFATVYLALFCAIGALAQAVAVLLWVFTGRLSVPWLVLAIPVGLAILAVTVALRSHRATACPGR